MIKLVEFRIAASNQLDFFHAHDFCKTIGMTFDFEALTGRAWENCLSAKMEWI